MDGRGDFERCRPSGESIEGVDDAPFGIIPFAVSAVWLGLRGDHILGVCFGRRARGICYSAALYCILYDYISMIMSNKTISVVRSTLDLANIEDSTLWVPLPPFTFGKILSPLNAISHN
jgi:hypothetical protein